MEAKNIIIGGLALAVVGGGAYFYFKNKSKKPLIQQLTDSLSTTAGVPASTGSSSTGTSTSSTPDKVLDNAPVTNAQLQATQQENSKQIQAQGLANQISSLKSQFATLQTASPYCNPPMAGDYTQYNKCNNVKTQIIDLQNKMKDLGYKEDNGLAVKL